MQAGDGRGDRADRVATAMLGPGADGHLPILVSAEHIAWLELPGQRIDFVHSEVLVRGRNSSCLIMWDERHEADGNSSEGSSFCDERLPEEIGPILDNSSGKGPKRYLVLSTSPETAVVRVETTSGALFTVWPAGDIAYFEWPAERGDGVAVIGEDSLGDELWTAGLPFPSEVEG